MLKHPTVTCMDDGGSGRLLSEWVHQNCSDSVMTEEQRLLYNQHHLGIDGAAAFELQYQQSRVRMTPEAREERRRLKSAAQLARNAAARNKIVAK